MNEQKDQESASKVKTRANSWKTAGVLMVVLSLILAGLVIFLTVQYCHNNGQIDQLTQEVNDLKVQLQQVSPEGDNSSDNSAAESSYLTHTTKRNYLTFDYPAAWSVEVAEQTNGHGDVTTVTTTNGYQVKLLEDPIGGIGGWCDPADPSEAGQNVIVTKEADSRIPGMMVISHESGFENDSRQYLYLSTYTGPFGSPVSRCNVFMTFGVNFHINTTDSIVTFGNAFGADSSSDAFPDSTEYPEVVKLLASLRQE